MPATTFSNMQLSNSRINKEKIRFLKAREDFRAFLKNFFPGNISRETVHNSKENINLL